jgi:hypothetical protein
MSTSTLITCGKKISREELASIPTPEATRTHRPVPHHEIVQALIETLTFRHIGVLKDEYAVSSNGMKMFGVLDLETGFEGCHFSIGIRNSHDKSFRLSATCGLRVTVCDNMMFSGDFTPVLAKPRLESMRITFGNPTTPLRAHATFPAVSRRGAASECQAARQSGGVAANGDNAGKCHPLLQLIWGTTPMARSAQ